MSKNINDFKGHIDQYLHNRAEVYTALDSPPLQLLHYNVEEEVQGKSRLRLQTVRPRLLFSVSKQRYTILHYRSVTITNICAVNNCFSTQYTCNISRSPA